MSHAISPIQYHNFTYNTLTLTYHLSHTIISFHVAGVAQTRIYLRFPWQAWHSWHWVARLGVVWARVTPRHFAWQAWHNLTSTFVLHGRRGTISHPPSFCVAGVALMGLGGAWAGLVADDAAALCVAGVAQSHIPLRFTWQAWHNLTSTFVLRGRRGTHGTGWRAWAGLVADDAAALCVAGVAQSHIPLRFTWQAWRNPTSAFVLRGRRGTHGTGWRAWAGLVADDAAALCVAGVAQSHIPLRFTWQAWHTQSTPY